METYLREQKWGADKVMSIEKSSQVRKGDVSTEHRNGERRRRLGAEDLYTVN
jgi:hypothetical protein